MLPRFFAPALDPGDESVTLPRDEAEHLTRVLRIGVGDTVAVFDGRGREFLARVAAARRRDVRVELLSPVEPAPESAVSITLVQAVLKGEKMDDVVRDATMLGVSAIQPVVTKRTETSVGALLRGARPERWRRVALASTKQSRRAVLPAIHTPLAFEHFLEEPRPSLRIMLVEPSAEVRSVSMRTLRERSTPHDVALVVGPEGGWDAAECERAASVGMCMMSLGSRTLRADAVPIAALSILQFLWEA